MTLPERVLYYVSVLNRLRVERVSMPAPEFIYALEDVVPREVKSDFLSRGVNLDTSSTVTLHPLYWKTVAWQNEVEREALETSD